MDRLKKDLEHIRTDGIDSGALYKRVCKYLSELLSYMATGLTPEEIAKLQTEVDFARLKEIWGETPAKVEFGVPFDRLRELLQAERDGRLVVLPRGHGCPMGYMGMPGQCPNCGGLNIRQFSQFDMSVCMDCGWDNEAKAAEHLIKMIRNAEIDISMLFEPVGQLKGEGERG